MAEITTRIVLRNDSAEAWATDAGKATALKAGEAAVEFVNGKAKLKIATADDQTFANAPYIGGAEANVFQVELADNEMDIDGIDRVVGDTELAVGDIAIVKAKIGDSDKVSYTSYVYEKFIDENNAETFAWVAMDGNYSAQNVYLNKGIKLTSAVGNYAKDYNIAAGTSLENVLSGLLQKEEQPTVSNPSAEITASGGSNEVGVEYTVPTATLKIKSVGSYTYGPATGVKFNARDIKLAEGAEPTTATNYKVTNSAVTAAADVLTLKATGDKAKYTDAGKSYTFSGSAAYQAATASPVTNLGNPSTKSPIAAGSCSIADKTVSFTGWRRMFMGTVNKDATINSDTIRGLTLVNEQASKNTKEFTAPVGTEKILIAFPRSISTSAPGVQYFTMSWEDFGDFTLAADKVQVADAAGELTTNDTYKYMVYAYTPADPLKADTKFKVTLK